MGTARAPVFGSGRCPACTWRVSKPNVRESSMDATLLGREKPLDHGTLARLFQQEAVVSVGRVDDMELDIAAVREKRRRQFLRPRWRIQPVRAEGDEKRPRRHATDRV